MKVAIAEPERRTTCRRPGRQAGRRRPGSVVRVVPAAVVRPCCPGDAGTRPPSGGRGTEGRYCGKEAVASPASLPSPAIRPTANVGGRDARNHNSSIAILRSRVPHPNGPATQDRPPASDQRGRSFPGLLRAPRCPGDAGLPCRTARQTRRPMHQEDRTFRSRDINARLQMWVRTPSDPALNAGFFKTRGSRRTTEHRTPGPGSFRNRTEFQYRNECDGPNEPRWTLRGAPCTPCFRPARGRSVQRPSCARMKRSRMSSRKTFSFGVSACGPSRSSLARSRWNSPTSSGVSVIAAACTAAGRLKRVRR